MAGEDPTSSLLEAPPLAPLKPEQLDRALLTSLANRIIAATWRTGLIQWSWGEGVYLLSEVRYHETIGEQIPTQLIEWFARREVITSGHINNVAPGAAAARLGAMGALDTTAIDNNLQSWLANPTSATRAANGAIEHWPGSVWADTCYMLGTYYLNLAVAQSDKERAKFIGEQLVHHFELLQNPTTKLFAHGSHRGETLWNYWGRGNAWMALSSVEFLDACEALALDMPEVKAVKSALQSQLLSLIPLLPEYGIWDVLVDRQVENKGILETSASAGIGSAMVRAARHLPEIARDLTDTGMRAIAAALTYVDETGVLTRTSAGTVLQLVPFGYSVIRSDRLQLWGQGLALNAITAALDPQRNLLKI